MLYILTYKITSLRMLVFLYPFFFAGYCWRKYFRDNVKNHLLFALGILYPICVVFLDCYHYEISNGSIPFVFGKKEILYLAINVFRIVTGLSGCGFAVLIWKFHMKWIDMDGYLIKSIILVGRRSGEYYAINIILSSLFGNYCLNSNPMIVKDAILAPVIAAISIFFTEIVLRIAEKNSKIYYCAFGRKPNK